MFNFEWSPPMPPQPQPPHNLLCGDDELARLRAANARMRAALLRIAGFDDNSVARAMQHIANDALHEMSAPP